MDGNGISTAAEATDRSIGFDSFSASIRTGSGVTALLSVVDAKGPADSMEGLDSKPGLESLGLVKNEDCSTEAAALGVEPDV